MIEYNRMLRLLSVTGLTLVIGWLFCSPAVGQKGIQPAVPVMDIRAYRSSIAENPSNRLVALDSVIPLLKKDIRYAGTNNFTGRKVYESPGAFTRWEVATALKAVADTLERLGLGLMLYDAYRPYRATKIFWELVSDERYVASPLKGSRHNRGAAVDVTLYKLEDGSVLPMPTEYDDFSDNAHSRASAKNEEAIRNRTLLQKVMVDAGFELFETEWWHFDFKGWEVFPLLDVSFEDLSRN